MMKRDKNLVGRRVEARGLDLKGMNVLCSFPGSSGGLIVPLSYRSIASENSEGQLPVQFFSWRDQHLRVFKIKNQRHWSTTAFAECGISRGLQ